MDKMPPILIIAIDSETETNPFENDRLSWASKYNPVLSYATVIAVLYDPEDVVDVGKLREGFPKCNLTKTARERIKNSPHFKKVTTLIYSLEKVNNVNRWSENLRDDYYTKAVKLLKEKYSVKNADKMEDLARVVASELMKRDITKDIVKLANRVKYSMLVAQNLDFDYNTMISKEELDKDGWRQSYYIATDLSAGSHLARNPTDFGDFLGIGSFGLLTKLSLTHVKSMYLVDTFGFMTYALAKDGHFLRIPKLHPGNLDKENFATHSDKIIAYNVRDTEILIEILMHFEEIILLAITQIELSYVALKLLKNFSFSINKSVFEARYRGDKNAIHEFASKIKRRDPGYSFERYLYEAFNFME